MKNEKEWAEHIIYKFGKGSAMIYATDKYHSCPCVSLHKKCWTCIYYNGYTQNNYLGCNDSLLFDKFLKKRKILLINDIVNRIKSHIIAILQPPPKFTEDFMKEEIK